jgi:Asp-tRNA(Asn)/Glu-tRNA(Gln) amidotransferase A subunit family amidase
MEYKKLSITKLHELLVKKEVTSQELVDEALKLSHEVNR